MYLTQVQYLSENDKKEMSSGPEASIAPLSSAMASLMSSETANINSPMSSMSSSMHSPATPMSVMSPQSVTSMMSPSIVKPSKHSNQNSADLSSVPSMSTQSTQLVLPEQMARQSNRSLISTPKPIDSPLKAPCQAQNVQYMQKSNLQYGNMSQTQTYNGTQSNLQMSTAQQFYNSNPYQGNHLPCHSNACWTNQGSNYSSGKYNPFAGT